MSKRKERGYEEPVVPLPRRNFLDFKREVELRYPDVEVTNRTEQTTGGRPCIRLSLRARNGDYVDTDFKPTNPNETLEHVMKHIEDNLDSLRSELRAQ